MVLDNSDFNAAYFAGDTGSAYSANNYLETALLSRTYFEMAEIISRCFRPRRVLEVGCGAGPVVYHLNNYFNVQGHGIDISSWAVENRLHPNVIEGTAAALPYRDGEFDLVFSCHAIEHLTFDTITPSIAEMSRVCAPDGVQFHMLPILAEGPYTDVFGSIVGLRKDATHNLLQYRAWWRKQWHAEQWTDTEVRVGMTYDNTKFEFSDCQMIMTRDALPSLTLAAIASRNLDVARVFMRALQRLPAPGLEDYLRDIKTHWPG